MVQWLGLHTFTAKRRFNPWLEGGAVELRSKELCGEAKKKKEGWKGTLEAGCLLVAAALPG